MFWILFPNYPILHFLLAALGFRGCWLDLQMEHPVWNGLTFYDMIYPLFLFLSGVSFPLSCAKSRERGISEGAIALKIVKRIIILYVLGMFIGGLLQVGIGRCMLSSVIGRIGITVGAASFIYMAFGWRLRLAIALGILLIYGALPFLIAPPGSAGLASYASPESCIYGWVDALRPKDQVYGGLSGLIPMVSTALFGMFAGEWLLCSPAQVAGSRKAAVLAGVAGLAMTAGCLVAYGLGPWCVPFNKLIWSSSFSLVTAGISAALLSLFYWIIDVKGFSRWSFAFQVIGVNSVFAYVASRSIFPYEQMTDLFFGWAMQLMPSPEWGRFVGYAGYMVVYWLLLHLMYRKGIFLKA